jgi:hypothetical protein
MYPGERKRVALATIIAPVRPKFATRDDLSGNLGHIGCVAAGCAVVGEGLPWFDWSCCSSYA